MTAARVLNFGCRLNAFEAEAMRGRIAGIDDLIVVNSCAVTGEAERQARQAIRRARREQPGARIVVTGCAAQVAPDRFAAMPEVDRVAGNIEKRGLAGLVGPDRVAVGDVMAVRETAPSEASGFEGRARAFVEIQQGCDHRCTFCIIPFARGPNRSVPMGAVVAQARRLVAGGFREIALTGVDITDYGKDLPGRPTLGRMVRRLLALVPGLPRLRLSSLDPAEIDEDLHAAIADEPRLMPHFHLSAQSGDDLVLKRMKRRHARADVAAFVARARAARPDAAFGADFIAGFPTESEEAHRRSLALVEECGLAWLHVFPYSERPGTPAARMPPLPGPVRKARAAELRAAGARQARRLLDGCVGAASDVLVEEAGKGRTPQYAKVILGRDAAPGSVVRTRIAARRGEALVAEEVA